MRGWLGLGLLLWTTAHADSLYIRKRGFGQAYVWVDAQPAGRLRNSEGLRLEVDPGVHEVWIAQDRDGFLTRCSGLVTVGGDEPWVSVSGRYCGGLEEGLGATTFSRGARIDLVDQAEFDTFLIVDGEVRVYVNGGQVQSLNVAPGGHTVIVARDLSGEVIVDQGVVQVPSGYVAQLTCTNIGCIGLTSVNANGPVLSAIGQTPSPTRGSVAPSVAPTAIPVCETPDLALPSELSQAGASVVVLTSAAGRRTAGVVADASGGILTTAQGLQAGESLTVDLASGISLSGTVTAWDGSVDLARVDVGASGLPCRPLFTPDTTVGSTVYTVGVPPAPGLAPILSSGLVGGYLDQPQARLLQTDTRTSPHLQGAPVLDASGRVVGLASLVDRGFGDEVLLAVSTQTVADWFAATLPSQAPSASPAAVRSGFRRPELSQEQVDAWNSGGSSD